MLVKLAICVPEMPCLSGDSLRPAFCTPWGGMEQVISVLSAPGPKTVEHQTQSSLTASLTVVVRKKKRLLKRKKSERIQSLLWIVSASSLGFFLFSQVTKCLLPPWLCCPSILICLPHVSLHNHHQKRPTLSGGVAIKA